MERKDIVTSDKSELRFNADNIVRNIRSNGYEAFFVGGCVRDLLMSTDPKEYDITTNAKPEEISKIFKKTIPIGENFGVVLVLYNGFQFEVATYRKDLGYSDGRHPDEVEYSKSVQEDVLRRDFTINGILLDPMQGRFIDHVGGKDDIEKGIIRTIGDPHKRFEEDKLRMLRAVRFSARFKFKIDSATSDAIVKSCSKINDVSPERIRDEIIKIITQDNPGLGVNLLSKLGLLKEVLPEVEAMQGVKQPEEFHPEGDVFLHTCLVLDKLFENTNGNYSQELAMGALLHDVGKPPTFTVSDRIRFNAHDRVGADMSSNICKGLRFSNKQIDRIYSLIKEHLRFKDVFKMKKSTLKRFLATPYFHEHLELHRADCLASHGMLDAYSLVLEKLDELEEEDIKPAPIVTGKDLISLGYTPGPIFSDILDYLDEAQLEGIISNKGEAIDYISRKFPLNQGKD